MEKFLDKLTKPRVFMVGKDPQWIYTTSLLVANINNTSEIIIVNTLPYLQKKLNSQYFLYQGTPDLLLIDLNNNYNDFEENISIITNQHLLNDSKIIGFTCCKQEEIFKAMDIFDKLIVYEYSETSA